MRLVTALITALLVQIALAQSHQFVSGFIYLPENTSDAWFDWIREIDPRTGASRIFAYHFDQFLLPNGLAFTPDGKHLRVLNYWADTVVDYDADGNGAVVYDSTDGICGPYGQNGVVFDRAGDCYIANDDCFDLLRFPAGGHPAVRIGPGEGSLALGADGALFNSTGSYRIVRIDLPNTYTIFDDFPAQHAVRSLTTNSAGDLFAAVGGPVQGPTQAGIYRYDQARLENKRRISAELVFAQCITTSADERELYIGNYYYVWAMNAQTGAYRVIYTFPGLTQSFGGLGITVYWPPALPGFVAGDVNCDGTVNQLDVTPFIAALTSRDGYDQQYPNCLFWRADVNTDGSVNQFDIVPFVDLLMP